MKWIALFESFSQKDKVKFVNEQFLYFKIDKDLNEMDLQMIETDSYIYFYNILHNTKILKFVYCKKHLVKAFTRTLVCSYSWRGLWAGRHIPQSLFTTIMILKPEEHHLIREIYDKAFKNFFSKYIDETFIVRTVDDWVKYEDNFRKTTSYNT